MTEANTLVLWKNPRERNALYRILSATGGKVFYDHAIEEVAKRDYRLVLVEAEPLGEKLGSVLEVLAGQQFPPAVLAVAETRTWEDISGLLQYEGLTNLIAKNTAFRADELIVTVQKILRNDIFGVDKYVSWGAVPHAEVLTDSGQRHCALDRLEAYLLSVGCNARIAEAARTVGDELLTNAIFHGPVDGSGNAKHASRDRTETVKLDRGEEVCFCYATDGGTLAISASDNFGHMQSETVLHYLQRCLRKGPDQTEEKEGGAGLGLYYTFSLLNSLIVNVAPARRTEVIGLLDVSGTYRDFVEKPKSLHLFRQEKVA